ncbi:MAG: ABC transporter ATP-binding protein [Acidimicrobiia bacterium]
MTLEARISLRRGDLELDLELAAGAGETVAVLGPNGAGKTTALHALSGLLPIERGAITLDGELLDDGRRTFVPPERRSIGVVFQDGVLFPHLRALDNVAFGLRARGVDRAAARRQAEAWLGRVGLADRSRSRPAELSGGERQRIALARALVIEPRMLLLDEPLASLDQRVRVTVRRDLVTQMRDFGGVRVLVTHDTIDAAVVADRIVVVEHGRVTQAGTLPEITARPRSSWVAELVGVNLLSGTAAADRIGLDGGAELVVAEAPTGAVLAVVHPHSVGLHAARPSGSVRNAWPATVASIEPLGGRVRVRVDGVVPLTAEITPGALADLALAPGVAVWTSVKATDVSVFAR